MPNKLKKSHLHSILTHFRSKILSHSNQINLALIKNNLVRCQVLTELNLLCQQLSKRLVKTAMTLSSIIRLILSLMVVSKFQGGHKFQEIKGNSRVKTSLDPRAEGGDMQLKTSSTKQWLKLCKERTERSNHLLIEEDQCIKLKTTHLKNSLLRWINSIRLPKSKVNSLMVTSWWTLKKAVHSWNIQLMELQHHLILMKMFQWEAMLHQSEEHLESSHLDQWLPQSKLD